MSLEEVKSVLEKYGAYHLRTKKHKRYKSNKETVNKNVIEYIHILIKEEQ